MNEEAADYGVKVYVNGRDGWAKLPGGVKKLTFSEASAVADRIALSYGLPTVVKRRDDK